MQLAGHRQVASGPLGLRRAWVLACLVFVAAAALPASAQAAFPWFNQAAMQHETSSELRDTFIVRPAVGATISRQTFLSQPYIGLYQSHGFDRNFFTWAPDTSVGDGYISGRTWTACKGAHVAVPGGPSHCADGAVKLGSEAATIRSSVETGPLSGLKWGDAFVSQVCGNWSPANGADKPSPMPVIRGVKYEDLNANGNREAGEPGLGGWKIQLFYNGKHVKTTTTATGGSYSFALDAESMPIGGGTYTLKEVVKSGWHQSEAPGSVKVGYGAGAPTFAGRDFGNWRPATISGHKFSDPNVDGLWGSSEPALSSWEINLSNGDQQLTGTDGSYSFSVRPGTYTIGETLQKGWRQTAPGGSGTFAHTVISGQVVEGSDFGNVCLGAVAVEPVDDSTGLPLEMEVRLEEVEVPGILENEPPLPRTMTGTPTFDELLPGTYRVVAFLPDGVFTTDPDTAVVEKRFAIVKEVTVGACATTAVPLHLFTESTPGKVTGGHIQLPVDGGFGNSGFEFMTRAGQPRGTLQYQDRVVGLRLHTSTIEAIHIAGDTAWVWGKAEVEGTPQRFLLRLVDAGEPGTEDRFELTLATGYEAGHGGPISGGNIQIHR